MTTVQVEPPQDEWERKSTELETLLDAGENCGDVDGNEAFARVRARYANLKRAS